MKFGGPDDAGWVGELRQVAARQRAELDIDLPGWPVYGFADSVRSGWLAGWWRQDGTLVNVQIGYGLRADETWLLVETQNRAGVPNRSLDWLLASMFAADGLDYPVPGALPTAPDDGLPDAPRAQPVEVAVDAVPVSALVQRLDGYVAWRVVLDEVVVTVTGHGVSTLPGLVRLTDLGTYASRRDESLAALSAGTRARPELPPLVGPDDAEPLWAHRGLLAMTIANRAENVARLALNRPFGRLDADWGPRWEAAGGGDPPAAAVTGPGRGRRPGCRYDHGRAGWRPAETRAVVAPERAAASGDRRDRLGDRDR